MTHNTKLKVILQSKVDDHAMFMNVHPKDIWRDNGPKFSKLLRKIVGRFLILGKS